MNAEDHNPTEIIKMLLIGNSGAGKTGALTSLVKEGYKLKIIDLDSGLDALINHVKAECPEKLRNIDYVQTRDKVTVSNRGPKVASPKALTDVCRFLEKWDDGSDPATWDKNTILVIDSGTMLGRAAMSWAMSMNPMSKDPRQWYSAAQDIIASILANVTDSKNFPVHFILISHIEMTEDKQGLTKGFASFVGKALGPKIPVMFNTLLLSEVRGSGTNVKRQIHTVPTATIDVKNPAPMRIEKTYPIETGLAEIFRALLA